MADNREPLLKALTRLLDDMNNPELETSAYMSLRRSGSFTKVKTAIRVLNHSLSIAEPIDGFIDRLKFYKNLFRNPNDAQKVNEFITNLTSDSFIPPVLGGSAEKRDELFTDKLNFLRVTKGILSIIISLGLFIWGTTLTGGASIAVYTVAGIFTTCFSYRARHVLSRIPLFGGTIKYFDKKLKKHPKINDTLHMITKFFSYAIPNIAAIIGIISLLSLNKNGDSKNENIFSIFFRLKAIDILTNLGIDFTKLIAIEAIPPIIEITSPTGLPNTGDAATKQPNGVYNPIIFNTHTHNKCLKYIMYDLHSICIAKPPSPEQAYFTYQRLNSSLASLIQYRREHYNSLPESEKTKSKNETYNKKTEMFDSIHTNLRSNTMPDPDLSLFCSVIKKAFSEYKKNRDTLNQPEPDKLFQNAPERFPAMCS